MGLVVYIVKFLVAVNIIVAWLVAMICISMTCYTFSQCITIVAQFVVFSLKVCMNNLRTCYIVDGLITIGWSYLFSGRYSMILPIKRRTGKTCWLVSKSSWMRSLSFPLENGTLISG